MKLLLIGTIITLSCNAANAQKIRFSNLANAWKIMVWEDPAFTTRYTTGYTGTEIIDGKAYYKLNDLRIREDTTTNIVYVVTALHAAPYPAEEILYDYNWKLHDTVIYHQINTVKCWVTAIDSTQISNIWYKVWHFETRNINATPPELYQYNIVEGIGCTNNFIYPLNPGPLNTRCETIICFSSDVPTSILSNPVTAYGGPFFHETDFDNYTSCFYLGADIRAKEQQTTTVIPNPVNKNSRIRLPYHITSGSLEVINDIGQMVMDNDFENKEELLLEDHLKTPGLYYYRVTDHTSGATFSGRFVRQNYGE